MPPINSNSGKVIDRIRKLIALAKGGGTEAEAEQAMKRVHDLLAKHNLRFDEVSEQRPQQEVRDRVHEVVNAANNPWERPIWHATASLYFCCWYGQRSYTGSGKTYRTTRMNHNFIGRSHNILVARLMTDYFLKTIRRLARQEGKNETADERTSFVHSFQLGCAKRLAERIWDHQYETRRRPTQADVAESILPALRPLYDLEEEANTELLEREGIRLVKAGRSRTRITNILGEDAGKRAAEDIGIDPQLGAGRADGVEQASLPPEAQMDLRL